MLRRQERQMRSKGDSTNLCELTLVLRVKKRTEEGDEGFRAS